MKQVLNINQPSITEKIYVILDVGQTQVNVMALWLAQ